MNLGLYMGEVTQLKRKKSHRKQITVVWGGSEHPQTGVYFIAKPADCGLLGECEDILSILTEDGESVNFTIGSVLYWLEKDAPEVVPE